MGPADQHERAAVCGLHPGILPGRMGAADTTATSRLPTPLDTRSPDTVRASSRVLLDRSATQSPLLSMLVHPSSITPVESSVTPAVPASRLTTLSWLWDTRNLRALPTGL